MYICVYRCACVIFFSLSFFKGKIIKSAQEGTQTIGRKGPKRLMKGHTRKKS